MGSWLLRSIGIGDELTSKLEQVQWLWARPTMLWIGLILLLPMVVLIVRRHRQSLRHVSPAARGMLTSCRVGVFMLLLFVLAGPYLRLQEQSIRKPVLIVLIDESESMTLPAGPFDDEALPHAAAAIGLLGERADGEQPQRRLAPEERRRLQQISRQQFIDEAMAHQRTTLWEPLAERFDLRAFRVARQLRPVELFAEPQPSPPTEALDEANALNETNIGDALQRVLHQFAGRPIGGVVLLSDGRWTLGPDPASVLRQQGGSGTRAAVGAPPLFSVPAGSSDAFADVRIVDVLAPARLSPGDSAMVLAYVDSHGFDGRAVKLRLLDEAGASLDEQSLTLSGARRQQVQFALQTQQPGAKLLSVEVDQLPEERVTANNQRRFEVMVDPERLRVLYLEGSPRWDFRFLDHALRRDSGLDVRIVMQSQLEAEHGMDANLPQLARLPEDAAGFAEYNVVILGDISPALLPPRLQQQLALAVQQQGVGLLVQGSAQFMPQAYVDAPLAELLPVRLAPGAAGVESPVWAPLRMKVEAAGAIHPAFSLHDSAAQNRAIWDRMPEFHWVIATTSPARGANVLASYQSAGLHEGEARPLIAEHFAGRGRVLFVGTDSTYRWRRNIGSHLFYRFWGQAIRHVARHPQRDGQSSWMQAHPSRVEPGEPVGIELYAVDIEGQPLNASQVTLRHSSAHGMDMLTLSRGSEPGHYRATWRPAQLGAYQLHYTDARGRSISAPLRVASSGREMHNPVVDRETLAELAEISGGARLEMQELDRLAQLAVGEPQTIDNLHEQEVWDNWLTLLLLVGLYCTDVGVRRLLGVT